MKNSYSILCVCTCVHTCRLPRVKVRRQHSGVRSSPRLARQCPACSFCCAYVLQASRHVHFGPLLLCPPCISSWECWDCRSTTPHPTFYVGSRQQTPVVGMAWHTIGCWTMSWPRKVFICWLCSNLISFCFLKAKSPGHWLQLLGSLHGGLISWPFLSWTPILIEMKYSLSCCSVTTCNIQSFHWIRLALEVWGGSSLCDLLSHQM